jgi:hypothetical protein
LANSNDALPMPEVALGEPAADLVAPTVDAGAVQCVPSQRYRARVLAEAVQEDRCRGPGAGTRQALQYTRPVTPPKAGMTSPAFPIGNMYKCPEPAHAKSAWHFLALP